MSQEEGAYLAANGTAIPLDPQNLAVLVQRIGAQADETEFSATLVPRVKFRTYDLGEHGGSGVSIETRDGRAESLQLGDFATASELRGWLTSASSIGRPRPPLRFAGRPLRFGDTQPLRVADLPRLEVRLAAASPAAPSTSGPGTLPRQRVSSRDENSVDQ